MSMLDKNKKATQKSERPSENRIFGNNFDKKGQEKGARLLCLSQPLYYFPITSFILLEVVSNIYPTI